MKGDAIVIFVIFVFVTACSQGKSKGRLSISPSIRDSFMNAVRYVDKDDRKDAATDKMTAILVPRAMGDVDEELFAADSTEGFVMPCQCVLSNDSLAVITGLAYEGGFAYISLVANDSVKNSLQLFGKKPKWRSGTGKWLSEITVPSTINDLVLSNKYPPKMDEVTYGMFEIETLPFSEKDGDSSKAQRHKLKIYFSCKVSPVML